MPITCIEILHDGEGGPGRSVEFGAVLIESANDPADYAERAAHHFDDHDLRRFPEACGDAWDFDNTSRVIEVRGLPGGPARFRVRCEVVRSYKATRLEG